MTIKKRLTDLEQVTQANTPEEYPEIVIHLGWEPGDEKITVDGVAMNRGEVDRRWPGWDKQPIDFNVNWGTDDNE